MSDRATPTPDTEADDLFRYGDRIARGRELPPRTDLEATALRVQRALRGADRGAAQLPPALKAAMWEEIMESTTAGASIAPRSPWRAAPGQPATRPRVPTVPHLPLPRTWRAGFANAVLALLLLLSGFAAWRTTGGFGSGGHGAPTSLPGVAANPSTPGSVQVPVVATPAASGCPLSGDIPIVPDLAEGERPLTTTALYLVRTDAHSVDDRRSKLILTCPDYPDAVLAENVDSAGAGPWPGTLSIDVLPSDASFGAPGIAGYVDVTTGATIMFARYSDDNIYSYTSTPGSPWVIGPSADDPSVLELVDLRTMEARPLADVMGIPVPATAIPFVSGTPATDGTLAVGFSAPLATDAVGGALATGTGAHGDLLLLGTSFDDTHWITVPASLPRISAVSLSPDGSHAAVVSLGDGSAVASSYRYAVIDTANGKLVGSSANIPYQDNPFVIWIQGGKSIAYLADKELQTIAVDGDGTPKTVLTADSQLLGLQVAWDPDVVVARTRRDHGSDAAADRTEQDAVFSVDVTTGKTHRFDGIDASYITDPTPDAGALVMYRWDDARPDTITYTAYDPVTGKKIGAIEDAPTVEVSPRTEPTLGRFSVATSDDGRVEVIGFGTQFLYAFTAGTDGLTMRRFASPGGLLSDLFLTANFSLSPDGSTLALMGEGDEGRVRYLTTLVDSTAGWSVIDSTVVGEAGSGQIWFMTGTDS